MSLASVVELLFTKNVLEFSVNVEGRFGKAIEKVVKTRKQRNPLSENWQANHTEQHCYCETDGFARNLKCRVAGTLFTNTSRSVSFSTLVCEFICAL